MGDVLFGVLVVVLCAAWAAYARWALKQWRNRPRSTPKIKRWVDKRQGTTMERLERKTHDWRLDGKPGSVGAAVIGLEAIDEAID